MSYNDWTLSHKKILAAFPRLSSSTTRHLPYAIGVLAFLGFLDATYLTVLHYKNTIPPCTLHGCETVLTSAFASVGGLPISLIGAIYYLALLGLVGFWLSSIKQTVQGLQTTALDRSLHTESKITIRTLSTLFVLLTGTGLLVGVFLVIVQAFILHAFCQYCLASELIDFLLFDCAWWLWRKNG